MRDGFEQESYNRLSAAMRGSGMATARLAGMKIRSATNPPRAAIGHMPFAGHRTQDQVLTDMTPGVRRKYTKR